MTTSFPLNGVTPGSWNVMVLNSDSGTATLTSGFSVTDATAATVSSISPTSGTVNTSVSVTLVGTGFSTSASSMCLVRSGYNDIVGSVTGRTSTQVTGTFNLNGQTPGTWTTRVYYDGTHYADGPSFTINPVTPVNGTVSFSTNPSAAAAYLNGNFQGKTPVTSYNITPGTYTIRYQRSGYNDWSGTFTVTAGRTTDGYARLTAATMETATTAPTLIRSTVTTFKRTTTKMVTPWPASTPTQSPVDPVVILGVLGMGLIVLGIR
ncbi:MAG: hypothetical protein METHP_01249 [Methanoregula sp. SKADARSKE-2]|nr:MAG: hypothetical protein METHP_01249 [Methanoregula sp. SKADARSKE-2]